MKERKRPTNEVKFKAIKYMWLLAKQLAHSSYSLMLFFFLSISPHQVCVMYVHYTKSTSSRHKKQTSDWFNSNGRYPIQIRFVYVLYMRLLVYVDLSFNELNTTGRYFTAVIESKHQTECKNNENRIIK